MTSWGYARVSTIDQDTQPQFDALRRAGIDEVHIVTDHASGTRADTAARAMTAMTRLLQLHRLPTHPDRESRVTWTN